ncbi:MAG: 3-hydroxyacyl-CoA dehydrogenase NAD-binding domain-containing protein, partial [bacterium]
HVIGAGVMGGDIAAWCALRGLTASVHDQSADALARTRARAHVLFQRRLKSPRRVQGAMDRLRMDLAGDGARRADVIIEAIVERADAKTELLESLQRVARDDALLATNTSSIPLESLCDSLAAPGRLVGLHFFNPVARMELVEIVRDDRTDAAVIDRACAFARAINRLPIAVKSRPGFLVNRILMPYLLEAVALLGEGASRASVDRAATDFGMPLGPIALADTVGLDVCLHVAQNLTMSYGGEVPQALREKVEAGHLGKKSGRRFYRWSNDKPRAGNARRARKIADLQDRLIFRFLNEAVACLREGIVERADDLDAGMIFGAGFAPFRGGPMRYIADQGPAAMRQQLAALHDRHGDRFTPDAGWDELDLGGMKVE